MPPASLKPSRQALTERAKYNRRPDDLEDQINDACRRDAQSYAELRQRLKLAQSIIVPAVAQMLVAGELVTATRIQGITKVLVFSAARSGR